MSHCVVWPNAKWQFDRALNKRSLRRLGTHEKPSTACASMQSDQGFRGPLSESLHSAEALLIDAFALRICLEDIFSQSSSILRAAPSDNAPYDMCAQRRFRSACVFAQSDQNLFWTHFGLPKIQSIYMRNFDSQRCKVIHADTEDSDQTALIGVFVGSTYQKVRYLT